MSGKARVEGGWRELADEVLPTVSQHSVAFVYLQVHMDGQRDGFWGGFYHTGGLVGLASLVCGTQACAILVLHMVVLRTRGQFSCSGIPSTSACTSSANSH